MRRNNVSINLISKDQSIIIIITADQHRHCMTEHSSHKAPSLQYIHLVALASNIISCSSSFILHLWQVQERLNTISSSLLSYAVVNTYCTHYNFTVITNKLCSHCRRTSKNICNMLCGMQKEYSLEGNNQYITYILACNF
jgi:hypothetical protein